MNWPAFLFAFVVTVGTAYLADNVSAASFLLAFATGIFAGRHVPALL